MAATSTGLLDGFGANQLLSMAAALLLVALMTPVLGMSLDGRFAERIPGHGHVGPVERGHVHDFTHPPASVSPPGESGAGSPALSGAALVEYAPDVLAGGLTLNPGIAPPSLPLLAPPLLLPLSVAGLVYDDPAAAPPSPPPRPLG